MTKERMNEAVNGFHAQLTKTMETAPNVNNVRMTKRMMRMDNATGAVSPATDADSMKDVMTSTPPAHQDNETEPEGP